MSRAVVFIALLSLIGFGSPAFAAGGGLSPFHQLERLHVFFSVGTTIESAICKWKYGQTLRIEGEQSFGKQICLTVQHRLDEEQRIRKWFADGAGAVWVAAKSLIGSP
jgi:hypothetical protein